MFEKLIHTPEGELKSEDPFLEIGAQGYYKPDPNLRFVVSKEAIKYREQNLGLGSKYTSSAYAAIEWLEMSGVGKWKRYGNIEASLRVYPKVSLALLDESSDLYVRGLNI